MNSQDLIELKIPARAEYVGVARLFISGVANRVGFSYDDIEDMKVAVAEACTNAVNHAYRDREGSILLGCVSYEDCLEVLVIDHGQSFDIQKIKQNIGPIDQDAAIEQLNEGGLGLFLIQSLMDDVQIKEENGIVIMMTKYKNKDGVHDYDRPLKSTPSR